MFNFIIFLVILYFIAKSGIIGRAFGKKKDTRLDLRGKTEDQKKIIKYFIAQGFFAWLFKISDQAFDNILARKVQSYNILDMALSKLGVDVDEVQEINPIFLDGYLIDAHHSKIGADDVYRSSEYQLSCVLCSSTQIYLYSFAFDLTSSNTSEFTKEFFYKDITSITTETNIIEVAQTSGCLGLGLERKAVDRLRFQVVVPNDIFNCSIRREHEPSIQGMKAKLREKKL
jgi:hypothetical protein